MSNSRRGGSCFHAGSGMGSGLSPSLISNARFFLLALLALAGLTPPAHAAMERLAVSNNGRHLVTQSGTPFFWMGDTNWRLYKLNEQEVNDYLNDRSSKRFNVIQGPVLLHAEDTDNHVEYVNAYGEPNTDPLNPNEAYFQHVDYIVDAAEARNMYVALVCVWGSDIEVFGSSVNEQRVNAREYGEWLGERYRNRTNVIWIVAGEYNFYGNGPDIRAVWNALGNGLKTGSDGNALITIHASYQPNHQSSSILFHNSGWLDFNMIQSSQSGNTGSGAANWQLISVDWLERVRRPPPRLLVGLRRRLRPHVWLDQRRAQLPRRRRHQLLRQSRTVVGGDGRSRGQRHETPAPAHRIAADAAPHSCASHACYACRRRADSNDRYSRSVRPLRHGLHPEKEQDLHGECARALRQHGQGMVVRLPHRPGEQRRAVPQGSSRRLPHFHHAQRRTGLGARAGQRQPGLPQARRGRTAAVTERAKWDHGWMRMNTDNR
jgi:hypothetical protein